MELTLKQADRFVEGSPSAKWDGWNIHIYHPQQNACLHKNGVFFNGNWCLRSIIMPNSEGKYVISKRNAAGASRTWN